MYLYRKVELYVNAQETSKSRMDVEYVELQSLALASPQLLPAPPVILDPLVWTSSPLLPSRAPLLAQPSFANELIHDPRMRWTW